MAELNKFATAYDVKCPYCGRAEGTYSRNEYRYGSPIRVCKKCGKKFINEFYHEIAVEGPAPEAFSIKAKLKAIVIFAVLFAVMFLWHFYEVTFTSRYHYMPACAMIGLLVGVLFEILDIIFTKTGLKAKRTEKKRLESVQRLEDPEYARELAELGYNVPREYLRDEATQTERNESYEHN